MIVKLRLDLKSSFIIANISEHFIYPQQLVSQRYEDSSTFPETCNATFCSENGVLDGQFRS